METEIESAVKRTDLEKVRDYVEREMVPYLQTQLDLRIALGGDRTCPFSLPQLSWKSKRGIEYTLVFDVDEVVRCIEVQPIPRSPVKVYWSLGYEFDPKTRTLKWEEQWKSGIKTIASIADTLAVAECLPTLVEDISPLRKMGIGDYVGLSFTK